MPDPTVDSTPVAPLPARARLTGVQWLIVSTAAVGFAFDTYELLMLPLIVRPAILDLLGAAPGSPEFNLWAGLLFYVPALPGGIFGLIGGYLTDRFGRRRVLVWSILLYAGSAGASGFVTSIELLLVLRCLTFVGVCVEFVAAVAWLAELFADPKQRERVLGYTQVFASVGGLLVSGAYYLIVTWADSLPAIAGGHQPWRYLLISGLVPAAILIVVRPFLPESPVWREKRRAGTLARPRVGALFEPALRRTTILTTLMMACAYAASFGAMLHIPRIVPGLAELAAAPRAVQEQAAGTVQFTQELGGIAGRFLLGYLAVRVVSRRRLLRVFQLPGIFVVPLVLFAAPLGTTSLLAAGSFLAGLLVVGQFSFWGNYLPRVFPTHLRGLGESFAANVGGRLIGTSAALVTTQLANVTPGDSAVVQLAVATGIVAFAVFAIGLAASFRLPEPGQGELPE